jgi:hypothetical protein
MTYDSLIDWFQDYVDEEELEIKIKKDVLNLTKNIRGFKLMKKTTQQKLINLLIDTFKVPKSKYVYRRISRTEITKFRTAYRTKHNYYYAKKRVVYD